MSRFHHSTTRHSRTGNGQGDLAWERRDLFRIGCALKSPRTGDGGSLVGGDGEGLMREVILVLTTGELLEVLVDAVIAPNGQQIHIYEGTGAWRHFCWS